MDEEKYIHIKKEYIIIFAVMVIYSVISAFDSSYMFYLTTFWLLSLFMGGYFYINAKSIALSSAIWFGYSGIMELVVCKSVYGICFLTTLLFIISAVVTKFLNKNGENK